MGSFIINDNGNGYSRVDFVSALEGLQPLLVSGQNIKTINSQSVLGSGNIEVAETEYDYDLSSLEQTLHDDTLTKLAAVNPINPSTGKRKYVTFGFITDLHTMPTKQEIVANQGIEDVVSDIEGMGITLEAVEEGQTIAGQIRETWPTSDESYYGASAEPSVKLLGSIAHDFGLDAVFCDGDLSSGRLPYNSYAYMLEIVARMFDKYISVPCFIADGNHDRKYDNNVALRTADEWKKFQLRFNKPRGLDIGYVSDIQSISDYTYQTPLGYFVDIDRCKVRIAVIPMVNAKPTVSMNFAISIDDTSKNANEWTLCAASHTSPQYLSTYFRASLAGTARGKGAGSDQNQYPAMNGGKKLGACVGLVDGHIHQSLQSKIETDFFHVTVSNAYASAVEANTNNGYCFSIFTVDTDNWWLYEHQVGRRPRVDSSNPDVEGSYEKVADGIYRYKIYKNPLVQ